VFVGDVNVHLDDVNSTRVVRFNSLLSDFGLRDVVRQPTHKRGHQLDVFITRSDRSIASVLVDPPLISDHSLIVATFDAASVKQSADGAVLWRRCWRTFDYDSFASELRKSELVLHPPSDVTQSVRDCYGETLTTLLDKFAPLRKVRSKARPLTPWFNTDCRRSKAKTRKLEKVYRKKPPNESRLA